MNKAEETPISLEHVGMRFGNYAVHNDISFNIGRGEVVTILGPSGTGKTVLLKLMIGLLYATSGKVSTFGIDLANASEEELLSIRMRVGMLFQGAALFDSLSVYDNIAYSLHELKKHSEDEIAEIVREKLKIINLPGIEQKFPSQLSGGQKKRVGLARALASSPEVMLFDEPTTGLDPTSARLIDELILQLKHEFGITSVVITHDIASAARISDEWILINRGVVAAQGAVKELSQQNQDVQRFIKGEWNEQIS